MIGWRRRRVCCPVPERRSRQPRPVEGPARSPDTCGFGRVRRVSGLGGTSLAPHDATTSVHSLLFRQILMSTIHWKRFLHPGGVYRLEYPAHWEQVQKDDARSCGFGPQDRDDVGLWISVMPVSVDTARL